MGELTDALRPFAEWDGCYCDDAYLKRGWHLNCHFEDFQAEIKAAKDALNNAARAEAAIALADASVEGHEYRDGWSQCPFCLWVAGRDWDPVHDCEMEQYVALVRATEDVTPAPTEGE